MKAKSVLSADAPRALERALDDIDNELMDEVLVRHLKVNSGTFEWGDRFVQTCDFSRRPERVAPEVHICIATLTMVSGPTGNRDRAYNDFTRARDAMVELWTRKLQQFVPRGYRTRLSVIIALDETIPQGGDVESNLVEGTHIWVAGEADPKKYPIYKGKRSKRD